MGGGQDPVIDTDAAGLRNFINGKNRLRAISGKKLGDIPVDMIHIHDETTKS